MKAYLYIAYFCGFSIFIGIIVFVSLKYSGSQRIQDIGNSLPVISKENNDTISIGENSFLVCSGIRYLQEELDNESLLVDSLSNSGQIVGSKISGTNILITELVGSPFYFQNRLAVRVRTDSGITYIYPDSLEPVLVNFSDGTKSQISFVVSSAQLGGKKYANVFLANISDGMRGNKTLIDSDSLLIVPYIQIPGTSQRIEGFDSNEPSTGLPFGKTNIRHIITVDGKWFYIDTNTLEHIKLLENDSVSVQCRFKLNGEDFYGIYNSGTSMILDPIGLKKVNLKIPNDNDFIVSLTDKIEMKDNFYLVLVELNTGEWWYIDANTGKKIKRGSKSIPDSSDFSDF